MLIIKSLLLGAKDEVVVQAVKKLSEKYPNIHFDYHHGYFNLEDETVLKHVSSFNPDYVFVGMGYPKQEQWIERYDNYFKQTLLMGVGGSIEVLAERKKSAQNIS